MLKQNNRFIVLFDGDCNLCSSSVQFIINRDQKDLFRFASIQSEVGVGLIDQYNIDIHKNDSIILIQKKDVKYRSLAVLNILLHLKTFWRIFLVFHIIPKPIRDMLYNIIAKKRFFCSPIMYSCLFFLELDHNHDSQKDYILIFLK